MRHVCDIYHKDTCLINVNTFVCRFDVCCRVAGLNHKSKYAKTPRYGLMLIPNDGHKFFLIDAIHANDTVSLDLGVIYKVKAEM